jgi:site-specific DNA recombinase
VNRDVALIYVRVSRLDEDERARKVSPDMQREKALALRELVGLRTEVFEDLDISGKSAENRPGFIAMIRRLDAGDVQYVVAYDQSRITRNIGDLQRFREAIVRAGALFIESSTGRILDPEDEDQELGSNVMGSVDQHSRRKIARRVRDALATKVSRGDLVGPVPAGYVRRREILANGKIARVWVEADPERAPIIRELYRLYAMGTWSFSSLAREMNARGVPLPCPPHFRNGRGARGAGTDERARLWTADVLKDLLANPRYRGVVPRRDGTTVAASFEALVDEATWNACQRVRMQHRHVRLSSASKRPSHYLLSGVLRCGRCGSTMSGSTRPADREHVTATGERRRASHKEPRCVYACYQRRVARACDAPYVHQDVVESELLAILRSLALPIDFAEKVDAGVKAALRETGQGSRQTTTKSIRARLDRLRDLYELGDIVRDAYLDRRKDLTAQLEAVEHAEPVPSFARQMSQLRSVVDDWEQLTIDERRHLVALVVEEVHVRGTGIDWVRPRGDWQDFVEAVVTPEGRPLVIEGLSERKTGLEPATPTLARLCSTN